MVKGPIGIWPFPIANMFLKPAFSIKDHTVIKGSPDYTGDFEITSDENSEPWQIELVYETILTLKVLDEVGKEILSNTATQPQGHKFGVTQFTIDKMKEKRTKRIFIQEDPR